MTLVEYLQTLRRHWLVVVAALLLGAAAAYAFASFQPNQYRASSRVLVSAARVGDTSELVQSSTFADSLVTTYSALATSDLVLQRVIDSLGLDESPRRLARSVTTSTPLDTVLIDIDVVRGNRNDATAIANSMAQELGRAVDEVSPVVQGRAAVRVTTIQSATEPQAPISPDKRRLTLLGALIGLAVGLSLAFIRRALGERVKDARDVATITHTPVVGEVMGARWGTKLPTAVRNNPRSGEAESLRGLAANVRYLGFEAAARTLLLTSASPGEGKSNVASGLALILGESSSRILLIDADLRSPSVHLVTGLDRSVGLSSVLVGDYDLDSAIQRWSWAGIDVLASGPVPPNPGQLLNSDAMRKLLAEAQENYDAIVVDSGPVDRVSDAVWLGQVVDQVLVVARYGKTRARVLARALETLGAGGAPAAGVIISRVRRRRTRSTYGRAAEPGLGGAHRQEPAAGRALRNRV